MAKRGGSNIGHWFSPRLAPTIKPTLLDIAWAAGIYEGEGSCQGRPHKGSTHGDHVTVSQKDKWLLEKLKQLFGGSIKKHTGDCYLWFLCGPRCRGFLMTIYPFLSPRRKLQAMKVIGPTSEDPTLCNT